MLDHVVDDLTCRDCSGHPYGVGLYTREVRSTAGAVSLQYKYECMGADCCRGTAFTNTEHSHTVGLLVGVPFLGTQGLGPQSPQVSAHRAS